MLTLFSNAYIHTYYSQNYAGIIYLPLVGATSRFFCLWATSAKTFAMNDHEQHGLERYILELQTLFASWMPVSIVACLAIASTYFRPCPLSKSSKATTKRTKIFTSQKLPAVWYGLNVYISIEHWLWHYCHFCRGSMDV